MRCCCVKIRKISTILVFVTKIQKMNCTKKSPCTTGGYLQNISSRTEKPVQLRAEGFM